jgi:hypothetical protein
MMHEITITRKEKRYSGTVKETYTFNLHGDGKIYQTFLDVTFQTDNGILKETMLEGQEIRTLDDIPAEVRSELLSTVQQIRSSVTEQIEEVQD